MGYAKFLLYIEENHFAYTGVRYFIVAFPIYIGAILHRDMQNYSYIYIYIYRNTTLISVKVYITVLSGQNFCRFCSF